MALLQVDPVRWLDHEDSFVILQVFIDDVLNWSIMLLVGHIDMTKKRTLSRQKCTGDLEAFCVPVFLLLFVLLCIELRILLRLDDETDFRRVTKVGNHHQGDLIYE